MKKSLLFGILFLCGISAFSQIYTPVNPTTYGEHQKRLKADSAQHIPEKDSLYKYTADTTAQIFLNKKDSSIWAYSKSRGFFKIIDQSSSSTIVISDSAWSLRGNSGTTPGTNFLGTTDDNDLVFKRNGYEVGRFVHKELDINNMYLPLNNTDSTGIIYKVHSGFGKVPFIHNFEKPGTNGDNLFGGLLSGNLSLTGASGGYGSYNTGWGSATLYSLTTGFKNTAIGTYALQGNTTGWNNSALGNNALKNQSTSYNNTAMGIRALGIGVITGSSNSGYGVDALAFNTGGSFNQGFGIDALYKNTNGSYNSAFGDSTFWIHTTGIKNTAIGSRAGYYLGDTYPNFGSVKDSFCTFLGADATRDSSIANSTALKNLTVIGYNAKGYASNQVVLGNDSVTTTILRGELYAKGTASGVGTKALRINPGTGIITYADTLAVSGVYLPLAGGALNGNLLFSPDNTYDIGASGATRPRTGYFGTSLITPYIQGGYNGLNDWRLNTGLQMANSGFVGFSSTGNSAAAVDVQVTRARTKWLAIGTSGTVGDSTGNITADTAIFKSRVTSAKGVFNTGISTASGNVELNTTSNTIANFSGGTTALTISANGGTARTLDLKAGSGTVDIQQWQNSSGTALGVVNYLGNVGIGTSTPATNMEVYVTANAGGIRATSNGTASPLLGLYNGATEEGGIGWAQSANRFASGSGAGDIVVYAYDAGGTHKLNFATGSSPTVRMTIDGSGNVGIGTTSPTAAKLQVTGNGAASVSGGLWDGTWFTGGTATTTKPQFLIEPTGTTSTAWSTSGTGLGINAPSGFTGNLIDAQLNGVSKFKINQQGSITANGSSTYAVFNGVGISYNGAGFLQLGSSGLLTFSSAAFTSAVDATLTRQAAGILQVGTTTNNALGTIAAAKFQVATSVFWQSGAGSPEGVVTANIGSLYSRTDGGANTTLYVKESGTGNTGWVAK